MGATFAGVALERSFFSDMSDREVFSIADGRAVWVYGVVNDFSMFGFDFLAGDRLVAFNDAWSGDTDYDDFNLRARADTPIPGAVWLLGSGLIGLVGLRRRFGHQPSVS